MTKWDRCHCRPIALHEVVIAVCGIVVGFGVIVGAAFGLIRS